ncbi:MAG: hypothetical protein D6719_11145 [Candidatus Dadabacteria bacterium]|nr:MAG: hypothetical protein D6719_11145 [Candidatus Dadabacteria bacterium]
MKRKAVEVRCWHKSFVLLALLLLSACAGRHIPDTVPGVTSSGQLVLSRPLPHVSAIPAVSAPALLPVRAAASPAWLSLDLEKKTLALLEGEKTIAKFTLQSLPKSLKPGLYPIIHKQRDALWYAPDSYFTARHLPVPQQGDRKRLLRGALGEYVLYIKKDLPIYSGPVEIDQINGLRIDEKTLSRIYYRIEVGGLVEVK